MHEKTRDVEHLYFFSAPPANKEQRKKVTQSLRINAKTLDKFYRMSQLALNNCRCQTELSAAIWRICF